MVDETKKIYILDAVGTFCPIPIIRTAELIKDMENNEARKKRDRKPYVDVSFLRKELGL